MWGATGYGGVLGGPLALEVRLGSRNFRVRVLPVPKRQNRVRLLLRAEGVLSGVEKPALAARIGSLLKLECVASL